MISNTRVSFTISNCNLTGANVTTHFTPMGPTFEGAGIHLQNVSNGELVNNICNSNEYGIFLAWSNFNIVANNTCNNTTVVASASKTRLTTHWRTTLATTTRLASTSIPQIPTPWPATPATTTPK
ncbi:MAG: DUF1565 domain-containing protein [Candidatus Thorarchaeota archaeon]